MTDAINQQAAAATAQLEQMKETYARSPDQVAARAKAQLAELENDPHRLGRGASAERDRSILQSQINVAETEALRATEAITAAQRIDAVIAGQADVSGPETTYGSQIPMRDFASGYGDVLARGVRPETIKAFEETGHADDPVGEGREFQARMAAEWERRLLADPELQKRFLAKDPEVMRQFQYFAIYAADPRKAPRE